MNRRQLLQGMVATALSGGCAARLAAQAATPDVVVIGAGGAGLTAASALLKSGRTVLVLEARDRVGGRAFTDTSLGAPWDRGGSWLHASEVNPFVRYAREQGFEPYVDEHPRYLYRGTHRMSGAETAGYRAVNERIERELADAGRRGHDIPAEAALTQALMESGFTDEEAGLIMGGNAIRFFRDALPEN